MIKKYGKYKKQQHIWEKELIYNETPYFIEIDLGHIGQPKDIETTIKFLKNIITHKSLHQDKKTIIIYNIDVVCIKNKSYSFRVILENFSNNNIFICSTYNISCIENPIKSRFICYRIPLLSSENIQKIVNLYDPPNINLATHFINKNNLQLSILYSQMPNTNIIPDITYNYPPIIDIINNPTYEKIRNISHKICINDISIADLIFDFIKYDPTNKAKYLSYGCHVDHQCVLTDSYLRPIYIEYLLHIFINNINI
jgi:hypothetical protein